MQGGSGRPIIIVPAGDYPGNISLKNSIKFLRDGKFEDHKIVQQSPEEKNALKLSFSRKIGDQLVTFDVYDSVYSFTKSQWRRVVCLFTNGEHFQLKDWPPKESDDAPEKAKQMKTVNLFYRIKGFYLHY